LFSWFAFAERWPRQITYQSDFKLINILPFRSQKSYTYYGSFLKRSNEIFEMTYLH